MAVLRIVANIATPEPGPLVAFYAQVLGLSVVMDHGWIATLAGSGSGHPQISIASEGGSGAPVPAISIEVDDLDAVHARALAAGAQIAYPLCREPWGVRRFFVRDPVGTLVNVLAHDA